MEREREEQDIGSDVDAHNSRQDAHFGRPDLLDPSVFAETLYHFPDPVVELGQAARARQARVETSNRTNPEFTLSATANRNSLLETAIYLIVFGDREAASVPKETLVYFFGMFRSFISSFDSVDAPS